jgi:membrane dipeptidase
MKKAPEPAITWDAHACFPLRSGADMTELERYRQSGVSFLSVNIGMDMNTMAEVVKVTSWFRDYVLAHPQKYVLAESFADIEAAAGAGRLAIAFDLEGCEPLDGLPSMVELYHQLCVRQMLLAYNQDNRACGGCLGANTGLTALGHELIKRMNQRGMILDLSHMSRRATLEAIEASQTPPIFSHSNPSSLHPHPRNIDDDQIVACARRGGVIGINGLSEFLGGIAPFLPRLLEHIDYVAELAGPEHVGIGLDYVVDQEELVEYQKNFPEKFVGFDDAPISFLPPEIWASLPTELRARGYAEAEIAGILGENFARVARQVWKTAA